MLFTTFSFTIFFIVVFCLYYFVLNEKTKLQNWLLLISSYFFYGYANWRMIPIILISTLIFYGLGIAIRKADNIKKAALYRTIGIISGIGVLLYFKYLNFFIESFVDLFKGLGLYTNWSTFQIIMPLGVSYFTFKLISYVIEIFRGKMEPEKDFVAFATYVAFFPTIIAGPIDRPNLFIPQLHGKRSFDYEGTVEALKRILWGLFMKVCIADRLAIYIDAVYGNVPQHNGTTLTFAILLYPFQMYADFGGYSNIAIGVGKILGFKIQENFNRPFFTTNVADFWRKWHISLTSWVTDYVYMPLNVKFRNLGKFGIILAIIINMVVIGIWHGANWTYAVFGLYQGILFIPLIISGSFLKPKKQTKGKRELPTLGDYGKMTGVFILMAIGMMIFRSTSVNEAFTITRKIVSNPGSLFIDKPTLFYAFLSLPILLVKDFKDEFQLRLNFVHSKYAIIRYSSVVMLVIYILFMGVFDGGQFIYFQF